MRRDNYEALPRFGLTPASRSRLQVTEPADEIDPIDAAISQMPVHPDFVDRCVEERCK